MLEVAVWVVGAAVLLGVGLSAFYLAERPIQGAARWASVVHGLVGVGGAGLTAAAVMGAADPQGLGRIALVLLGAALLGATVIVVSNVRRRRPGGLVVALHAIAAVSAAVILAAYAGTG